MAIPRAHSKTMTNRLVRQFVPIVLTILTFFALCIFLYLFIHVLNLFPTTGKIVPFLRLADILVGLTIYLKTSVDFAIFIGMLMKHHAGVKNRVAIEIGTALGNALGTFFVLLIWTFFKEVPLLMVLMIFLASLVLLRMAEEGLGEFVATNNYVLGAQTLSILKKINYIFAPIITHIIPHASKGDKETSGFFSLLFFAFTVPLILGLDDFAGYIPLFNIINVFGFAVGVFLGHMILNVALFASPATTIKLIEKPLIALFGSIAFIGIAVWGFVEIFHLLTILF